MRPNVLTLGWLLGLMAATSSAPQKSHAPTESAAPKYSVIRQGRGGTCWIVSSMVALQFSGVDLSKRVKYVGDGHYEVRLYNFNDFRKPFGGTHGETYQVSFDGKTLTTDPVIKPRDTKAYWVVALHRGVITALRQWDKSQSIENPHGGDSFHAFGILTGRSAVKVSASDADVRRKVEGALKRSAAVTWISKYGATKLFGGHEYAVLKSSDKGVLLHNPWGVSTTYPWKVVIEDGTSFQILETDVHSPEILLGVPEFGGHQIQSSCNAIVN